MLSDAHHFVRPADASAATPIPHPAEFDRCHPDETLDDIKRRAAFTKEDRRLYQDWMALAATRAEQARAALRSAAGPRLPMAA